MTNGYIKLHRKITDWEWYDDSKTLKLFIHCILKANHKDKKWRGILVKKGSFITSYEKLALETKLSLRSVRTSLKRLETTCEVTRQSSTKYTVITVNNYLSYQGNDMRNDKQTTNKRQTNDKQTTTTKNDKNVKNDKNKSIPYSEIKNLFNEICSDLPQVRMLTEKRKRNINARWSEDKDFQTLEFWKCYFEQVAESDFLCGRKKDWSANFDWIMKKGNFVKVLEGVYKNKGQQKLTDEEITKILKEKEARNGNRDYTEVF